jgi:hypothetical protein
MQYRLFAAIAVALALSTPATAATFQVLPEMNGQSVIIIEGEIDGGDDQRFVQTLPPTSQILVVLSSPGGEYSAPA